MTTGAVDRARALVPGLTGLDAAGTVLHFKCRLNGKKTHFCGVLFRNVLRGVRRRRFAPRHERNHETRKVFQRARGVLAESLAGGREEYQASSGRGKVQRNTSNERRRI